MTTVLIAVITAVAAVAGSFVTWKLGKRNTSGAIDTSVASDLWAEGGKIRGELRADLADTKSALSEAVAAITALNEEIRLSRQETRELRQQIVELTAHTTSLHNDVKTGNALTLGGLADNQESRRIMDVRRADRTASEAEHLDTASDRLPVDLAADQSKDTL